MKPAERGWLTKCEEGVSRLEENEHASNEVFAQDVVLDVEGVVFDTEGQQLEDDG